MKVVLTACKVVAQSFCCLLSIWKVNYQLMVITCLNIPNRAVNLGKMLYILFQQVKVKAWKDKDEIEVVQETVQNTRVIGSNITQNLQTIHQMVEST